MFLLTTKKINEVHLKALYMGVISEFYLMKEFR